MRGDKITYVISSTFDYSKVICEDVGYMYADSMGWNYLYFNDFVSTSISEEVYIFDLRLSEVEIEKLPLLVETKKDCLFGFSLVDPGEYYIKNYFYRNAAYCAKYRNTFLLLKYHATSILEFFEFLYGSERTIVLPYPYDKGRELNIKRKKLKIIFSGRVDFVYPEREWFKSKMTKSPLFFLLDILKHPGYTDFGEEKVHGITGDDYVRYLSKYRFMFVSPSKYEVELLKYNECAYAGCIPVGFPPQNYPDEIKSLFIKPEFGRRFIFFIKKLFNYDRKNINTLRLYLYDTRRRDILNEKLKHFIKSFQHNGECHGKDLALNNLSKIVQ